MFFVRLIYYKRERKYIYKIFTLKYDKNMGYFFRSIEIVFSKLNLVSKKIYIALVEERKMITSKMRNDWMKFVFRRLTKDNK